MDFKPDESVCGAYCLFRVNIPVTWKEYGGGTGNCADGAITDSYFQIDAWVFDNYDGTLSVYVYAPWGTGSPYLTTYQNLAVTNHDYCHGDEFDMDPEGGSPVYADLMTYTIKKDGVFFPYQCGGGASLRAGGYNHQCSRNLAIDWPELHTVDYPGTYAQNLHYPIEVTPGQTLGGS